MGLLAAAPPAPDADALAATVARLWTVAIEKMAVETRRGPASARRTAHTPSVEQLLNDPLVLTLMQADRVDPATLRAMLSGAAAGLRASEARHP